MQNNYYFYLQIVKVCAVLCALVIGRGEALAMPVPVLKSADLRLGTVLLKVKEGDTLSEMLENVGIPKAEAKAAIAELSPLYNVQTLKLGQKFRVNYHLPKHRGGKNELVSLQVTMSNDQEIQVKRVDDHFEATEQERHYQPKLARAKGVVEGSLFGSASKAGVPSPLILDLIKAYSYDVDFQRDIKKGDTFEVLFEQYYDNHRDQIGFGEVIYASLHLRDRDLNIYQYTTLDGNSRYYTENGEGIEKSLLRTPVDGAQITSGFGERNHPLLGYSRAHKGIDFGAPEGTPVYAAGDGIIQEIGRKGDYGKYIRIFHNDEYSTAYAHLDGYADDIKSGAKVKQGQVIGYVGETGLATGPHLHYEVLAEGNQINPLSIQTVSSDALGGVEYGIFQQYRKQVDEVFHDQNTIVAQAEISR